MKEKKNDIRAVIGKTVTAKKKESGSRGRKQQEEMAGEISKTRSLDEKIYRKDKFESQVIRKR